MKFYKNKWFWGLVIFVVLSISWSAFTSLAKNKGTSQTVGTPQKIEQQTLLDAKYNMLPDTMQMVYAQESQIVNTQDQKSEDTYDKTMKKIRAIAKNKIVQAEEDKTYGPLMDVVVARNQLVVLQGYTTSIGKVFYLGKYYLIVDLGIYNLSDEDYVSSWSNFALRDTNGYSFLPSFSYPYLNGDIEGIIKPGESKRGQLAFEITSNQQVFVLDFGTNAKSPNTVHFLIDLTQYFKQFQSNQNAQG